jgi:DNA-binding transcriptional regulator YdaS (Cro superfamily)
MTTLREYMFYNDMTVTAFAKLVGVTRNYISQISRGHMKPSRLLAKEIERITEGKVKAEDLLKGE